MAWSVSAVSRQAIADMLTNIVAMDLDSDAWKMALFNNSVVPDKDATAANFAYNTGTWLLANEVSSSGQWAVAGVTLASKTVTTPSTGVVMFDAADPASGSTATMTNVYGGLVYDDTLTTPVAKQGLCFNYFGGANSVTSGTFTVVLSANGIMRITV